ncbi:TetR/AcrR family transcriptional regulator [Streptomyces massasporeus]|uniref:TetR/AcrR family transcriptional regulator n=1 Tax=Streptomyces massasporeus TaxID=67324 RepID=UPI00380EFF78
MTPPTRPRGAASRELLLHAAAEELAENGTLEVAAVAARAGVSAGLPYRYFGTRNGLLIAVVEAFYERLAEACALREYDEATWAEREWRRLRDWVDFLYAEPLATLILGGLAGDGEVAASHSRRRSLLIDMGARNIARAQHAGELPPHQDPELLAAATLGGVTALVSVALTRTPRPSAEEVRVQLWAFVSGAVNLPAPRHTPEQAGP